jgi:uncharacterized membrane protein YvbJ
MDNRCEACSKEWQERYNLACQRFDRQIEICTAVTVIASIITLFCIIIAACCLVATHKFINQFEYVEETETIISQDGDGQNIAVLVDNSKA